MNVIPEIQANKLKSLKSNFSLFFSRMTDWEENIEKKNDAIIELGKAGNEHLKHVTRILAAIHHRQHRLVQQAKANGQFGLEIRARLKTPFVSGLGSGHPTETGMILDRNTGLPYIPASSIKGVLRLAHAVNILNTFGSDYKWIENDGDQINLNDCEPSLRRYFGDINTKAKDCLRGQLVFLDAYPKEILELKQDIMNPHNSSYYGGNGKKQPVETESPIPVKFLTVNSGETFYFRGYCLPVQSNKYVDNIFTEEDYQAIQKMFLRAFADIGFGGKTSIGYGRFEMPNISD